MKKLKWLVKALSLDDEEAIEAIQDKMIKMIDSNEAKLEQLRIIVEAIDEGYREEVIKYLED